MSRIIFDWKCEKCDHEFYQYVSFGHPNKDFVFIWECGKCNHKNKTLIKALPDVSEKVIQEAFNGKTIKINLKQIEDSIIKVSKGDLKNGGKRQKNVIK